MMENNKPYNALDKQPKKTYVAVALVLVIVATMVVAVTIPAVLCQDVDSMMAGNSSVGLEKALAITNRSLAEARWQRDSYRKKLEVRESELEQARANVTQLRENNRVLQATVAQLQEQLKDLQNIRDKLQLQNQLLQEQLWNTGSRPSAGDTLPVMSLSLLALLLPGMLFL